MAAGVWLTYSGIETGLLRQKAETSTSQLSGGSSQNLLRHFPSVYLTITFLSHTALVLVSFLGVNIITYHCLHRKNGPAEFHVPSIVAFLVGQFGRHALVIAVGHAFARAQER